MTWSSSFASVIRLDYDLELFPGGLALLIFLTSGAAEGVSGGGGEKWERYILGPGAVLAEGKRVPVADKSCAVVLVSLLP